VLNTFERNWYGRFIATYFGVMAGLDLAWLLAFARTADQLLPGGFLLVFFGFFAPRARKAGRLVQTDVDLRVREVAWTGRLPRDMVNWFTVESGQIRPLGVSGSFLAAELKDGRVRQFKEFSAPSRGHQRPGIDDVAAALNSAWHLGSR